MAYDIVIKSGSVFDGNGNAPVIADIGINGGEIAMIGKIAEAGEVTIDANEKYVSPGFIDLTNHSDTRLTLFSNPGMESMLMQGVTTIIGGNCGSSLAPLGSSKAIEGLTKWADLSQININWATIEEFFRELQSMQFGVNFGTFAGYGTLRRGVTGDEIRLLNQEEREKVKLLLRGALDQGAFGLSLGLSYGHEAISPTEEIMEISRVIKEAGGIIKLHLRSEGGGLLASVNEAARIGRENEIPVQISHLKAIGKKAWPSLNKALQLIENARTSGVDINFDVSPYATTGSALYLLLPGWTREGGFSKLFARIDDASERTKIIDTMRTYTLHYDKILITSARIKNIVGRTIAEIAATADMSPEDALLDTIRANEGRVSMIGRTVSIRNTRREIEDAGSFISSDGLGLAEDSNSSGDLVHPRSFGAFPRFWHRYVNELQHVSAEKAVWKMTGGPAQKIGLKERGVLAKGNAADIVVFDPITLKDEASYRNPYRYAQGIEHVLVNGRIAVAKGKPTGMKAGKVIKKM